MSEENAESLTPAQVADLLAIPPSTLRTYATEFGPLLSRGAQGDPAGAGRAFRHRRYTRDDLQVLARAITLVDAGLSYRAALARLSNVEPGVIDRRLPQARTTRGGSSVGPADPRDRASPQRPSTIASSPRSPSPSVPLPESTIQFVADPAAGEAIQTMAGVVRRLVNTIEEMNSHIARIEDQLDAIRNDARRRDTVAVPPPAIRKNWLVRLFARDG